MEPSNSKFYHPYASPYDIQLDFMRSLYQCIEEHSVGIFESPTGTGKSLSLICGSLTWLRDDRSRQLDRLLPQNDSSNLDWLEQAEIDARRRELLLEKEEWEEKLALIRKRERAVRPEEVRPHKRARIEIEKEARDDEEYLLEEYENDKNSNTTTNGVLSASTLALLDKLKPRQQESEVLPEDNLKVIFCSRTHSQLSQIVTELRRVNFPSRSSSCHSQPGPSGASSEEHVKHLPLGSRKNLCINPKVARLPSTTAINETCLELQKPGTPKDRKCEFLPGADDRNRVDAFKDHVLAVVRDIEDVGQLGKVQKICPYYASRAAIAPAEVLTLPYPLLLQKSSREAIGVSVKDNVIVIDEAHNLMDAIADTFSMSLSLDQITLASEQLFGYVQRFKTRLKGQNRAYIAQTIRLLNSFATCLKTKRTSFGHQQENLLNASDLVAGKGVDQIQLHPLIRYLQESKLVHKVEGYAESHIGEHLTRRPKGALMHFKNFLATLVNPQKEGQFFINHVDGRVTVRYVLLDPREHFKDIVEEARAVILAGGTMSPMSDFADYLFSYVKAERLKTFSFGHIVPPENLLVKTITKGTADVEFDFSFSRRDSVEMIQGLGGTIGGICSIVPFGVVVFFPSYDMLARASSVWREDAKQTGSFAAGKEVFEETKASSVDDLLRDYAQAAQSSKGALLLAVVGGKLSEGINFSDNLGRGVVAVGLPFPNPHGAEWKAKLDHIEEAQYQKLLGFNRGTSGRCRELAQAARRDFYDNACMRAVNQSIGRAIRHKNDYAAIFLIDRRYATERIRGKLSAWIRSSVTPKAQSIAAINYEVCRFFGTKG